MTKRCVITGASSGIGRELARELARRGWSVALLARRADLLAELAAELDACVAVPCDVTDGAAVREAVVRSENELGGPFDLAIANAGVMTPSHATKFDMAEAEQMIRVNVLGMMYLFDAVIPGMVERRRGHFAGIASLAGLRGLPTSSVYSASKAAMQAFLEASRVELAPYDVAVTIVNPGFVATPMTSNNRFKMPFLMQAAPAVRVIADGIEKRKRVVEFPRPMSIATRLARYIPDAIYDRVMIPAAKRRMKG